MENHIASPPQFIGDVTRQMCGDHNSELSVYG
jgi:hypothetical protein